MSEGCDGKEESGMGRVEMCQQYVCVCAYRRIAGKQKKDVRDT